MENLQNEINEMVGLLPEAEKKIVFEIVSRFLPDDVATMRDLKDIATARQEFANNETVGIDDIDWG